MTDDLTALAHEVAFFTNPVAGRLIVERLRAMGCPRDTEWTTTRAVWVEMKSHRRVLRATGDYPVRKPKTACHSSQNPP